MYGTGEKLCQLEVESAAKKELQCCKHYYS